MTEPVFYESHSHTPLCMHAIGHPSEYASVAQDRGLKGLIVTCHNPMQNGFSSDVRMREDQLEEYVQLVEQTRQQWLGQVDVRLGIEADYFEGHESYLEKQIASVDFQFVLGSVHPQIAEYRQRYWNDDPFEFQQTYFRLLAKAAETRLFDSISHPDLVKNFTSEAWNPEQIMPDICDSLDRIATVGTAMELNTSGVNKRIAEMNPFPEMLVEMRKRSIPVTIGSDAHEPGRVGDGFIEALELLTACGYEHVSLFLNRKRQEIPIARVLQSLNCHA